MSRDHELLEESVQDSYYLDHGGAIFVGEPVETLPDLDGLKLECRSASVDLFRMQAEKLAERTGGYVKLHNWMTCICMSPEQRDRLVTSLRAIEDDAAARVDEHFEAWEAAIKARKVPS